MPQHRQPQPVQASDKPQEHTHNFPREIDVNVNFKISGEATLYVVPAPPPTPSQAGVWFTIKGGGFSAKGKSPMSYTLPVGMQVHVQVSYVDAKGNPATVDGDTEWSSSDQGITTVTVDPSDSTKATIVSVDLGQSQITCRADSDLTEGTDEIMGTLDVEVVAGKAVSVQITPSGSPEPTPDPTPPDPTPPDEIGGGPASRTAARSR